METGLGNLYGNIVQNLIDNVPELKTVDIDMGQLKRGGEKFPLELPAAILKLENVVWEPCDAEKLLGTVHVRLKILMPFLNDDENYFTVHNVRDEVLAFFEMMHLVKVKINEITSGYHTALVLFNESHLKSEAEEVKWTYCLDYYCNVYSNDDEITGSVSIDYDLLKNNNSFMERTELSVLKIGER